VNKTAASLCLAACVGCLAGAGPLDPPSGPVQGTMKTLEQIEARTPINAQTCPGDDDATPSTFKITQPGSYYLTGNVTGETGRIGIEIVSNDVSIDLAGFALVGTFTAQQGVRTTTNVTGVTVRNGVVRGWGQSGVDLYFGAGSRVEGVSAFYNMSVGISAGPGSAISQCVSRDNAFLGMYAGSGSSLTGCAAGRNGASGFSVGPGSMISACSAHDNGGAGFECSGTITLTSCTATENNAGGFTSGYGSIYNACSAGNNTGDGFLVNAGATATACTAFQNSRDGFFVSAGSVENCQATLNGRDGIRLNAGDSSATGNTCRENGVTEPGAGIRADATGCRVDSNQAIANDYGIVATSDCMVVRNSARGNASGNYSFPSGSEYGQIISNPGNGFSSSNPWANFAF